MADKETHPAPRLLRIARSFIRSLQTHRTHVPLIAKLVLSVLFLAVFVPLWSWLRLRALLFEPLHMRTSLHGPSGRIVLDCELPDMIQTYLALFGIWEPDVTAFVIRRLQKGDTVIDVGANVGYFTLLAAQRVQPSGRVVAIEASHEIFETLVHHVALNEFVDCVRTINVAASDTEGKLEVYRGPLHNRGLTSTRQHRGMKSDHIVSAKPLQQLLSDEELRAARLIKIDVEGGEDAVLSGLVACVDRLNPEAEILVELSPIWWDDPDKTPHDVLRPLLDAGFRAYEIPNDYWPWRYLWPNSIKPPRRISRDLNRRTARLDLVLSRLDAEVL